MLTVAAVQAETSLRTAGSRTMQPPPSPGTERLRRLIDQAGVQDGDYLLCQVVVRALESLGSAKLALLVDSPSWPNIGYELQRMRETLVDWREARDEYNEDEEEAAEQILDDCIGKIKRACETYFQQPDSHPIIWIQRWDNAMNHYRMAASYNNSTHMHNHPIRNAYNTFHTLISTLGFRHYGEPTLRAYDDPVSAVALQAALRHITPEAFFELATRHGATSGRPESAARLIAHKVKYLGQLVRIARCESARRGSPTELAVNEWVYKIRELVDDNLTGEENAEWRQDWDQAAKPFHHDSPFRDHPSFWFYKVEDVVTRQHSLSHQHSHRFIPRARQAFRTSSTLL